MCIKKGPDAGRNGITIAEPALFIKSKDFDAMVRLCRECPKVLTKAPVAEKRRRGRIAGTTQCTCRKTSFPGARTAGAAICASAPAFFLAEHHAPLSFLSGLPGGSPGPRRGQKGRAEPPENPPVMKNHVIRNKDRDRKA